MTRGGRATRTRGPTTADQLSLYAYREQSERGSAGAVRAARARSDGVRSTPRRFPRAAATRASRLQRGAARGAIMPSSFVR